MSFGTFKQCTDKIPPKIDIEFSGMVEAWLNPECTKMVLYAHEKGHKINVYTTLAGMRQEDFNLIKEIPFQRFWLHLPSADKEENILVNQEYLNLLKNVYKFLETKKESTSISYHFRGREVHPAVKNALGERIQRRKLSTRADNVAVENVTAPKRKRGTIVCERGLYSNVLLPMETWFYVMDYGLKHILGNLLKSDYQSLFKSEEFLKVKKGLKDESLEFCAVIAICLLIMLAFGQKSAINWRAFPITMKISFLYRISRFLRL